MHDWKRSRNHVRWALAVSLVLHGMCAVVLLVRKPPDRPVDDAIEVIVRGEVATASTVASSATGASSVSIAEQSGERSASSAPPARSHGGKRRSAGGSRLHEDSAGPATVTGHAAGEPSVGVAQDTPAGATGLGTFAPSHPDLTFKPPVGEEAPRDVLAAPTGKRAGRSGDLPKQLQVGSGVTATIGEDGSIQFRDPKDVAVDGAPLTVRFDVTDQVMKLAGQDPYASVKRKLAEETREQRWCMAQRFRGERQKQELFRLSATVRSIAVRADLTPAQRREAIFDIWDECLEDSDSPTDYGAMARATIAAVVREVFPEGSSLGYRPTELLALNSRRMSKGLFAPYAPEQPRHGRRPDAGAPALPACP